MQVASVSYCGLPLAWSSGLVRRKSQRLSGNGRAVVLSYQTPGAALMVLIKFVFALRSLDIVSGWLLQLHSL